jgi:hypothetical protein
MRIQLLLTSLTHCNRRAKNAHFTARLISLKKALKGAGARLPADSAKIGAHKTKTGELYGLATDERG